MIVRTFRAGARAAAILAVAISLGGCPYWVAGHSKDYALIVDGQGVIDTSNHTSEFDMKVDGKDITCKGKTRMVHHTGHIVGDRGAAEIVCSDGRKAKGELVFTSMEGGTGTGADDCGNEFDLVWSVHAHIVKQAVEGFRQTKKARPGGFDRCDAAGGDAPPHRDPLS